MKKNIAIIQEAYNDYKAHIETDIDLKEANKFGIKSPIDEMNIENMRFELQFFKNRFESKMEIIIILFDLQEELEHQFEERPSYQRIQNLQAVFENLLQDIVIN